MIFAPMVSRRRKNDTEEKNEEQAEAKTTDRSTDGWLVGFRPVYVWDVSQTEGAELPKLDQVQGNPAEQLPRLIEFVKSQTSSSNIQRTSGLHVDCLMAD